MQMTIKQLMACAELLKQEANVMENTVADYRSRLDTLAGPYEDYSTMPETDKKIAITYEQRIKEYGDLECAYTLLADAIENKNVLVNLGVNL